MRVFTDDHGGVPTTTDRATVRPTRRGFLAGLTALSVVGGLSRGTAPARVQSDPGWSHYHGDPGRAGRSTAGDPETPSRVRWRLEMPMDDQDTERTAPVIAGETVFTVNRNEDVVAVDLASGTVQWSYTPPEPVQIAPAVGENRVFLGTDGGDMVCLARETGEQQWSVGIDAAVSTPVVWDGTVYYGHYGGDTADVVAFDAASGDPEWQTEIEKAGSTADPSMLTIPTPAIEDGTVVVNVQNLAGSGDAGLVGLNASDGTIQWQAPIGGPCYPPSVRDGSCYAIAGGGVTRVSLAGGSVRWHNVFEKHRPGAETWMDPGMVSIGKNAVYLREKTAIARSGFVALNKRTGEREWEYRTDADSADAAGVSVTGSRVYFALGGTLVASGIDSGFEAWTYPLGGDLGVRGNGSAPIVTPEGLLVKHRGVLWALDDESAQETEDGGESTPASLEDDGGSGVPESDGGSGTQERDSPGSDEDRGFRLFDGWNLTLVNMTITAIAALITAVGIIFTYLELKS